MSVMQVHSKRNLLEAGLYHIIIIFFNHPDVQVLSPRKHFIREYTHTVKKLGTPDIFGDMSPESHVLSLITVICAVDKCGRSSLVFAWCISLPSDYHLLLFRLRQPTCSSTSGETEKLHPDPLPLHRSEELPTRWTTTWTPTDSLIIRHRH